jgi:hypothetical protein
LGPIGSPPATRPAPDGEPGHVHRSRKADVARAEQPSLGETYGAGAKIQPGDADMAA